MLINTFISILHYQKCGMTDFKHCKTPLSQRRDSCHTVTDIWIQDADAVEQEKKKHFKDLQNTYSLFLWYLKCFCEETSCVSLLHEIRYQILKSNKTELHCMCPYPWIAQERIKIPLKFDFISYLMNRLETTPSSYSFRIHLNPTCNCSPSITGTAHRTAGYTLTTTNSHGFLYSA